MKLRLIMMGLMSMALAASCAPVSSGGGNEIETVSLDGEAVTTRISSSIAASNLDVFSCRATSLNPAPLGADAYFPTTPNHVMTVSAATAGLSIRIESANEFVLWVRSDNGSFCNTEQEGVVNRGSWSAGDYDIFIGSPTQGAIIEYTLTIEVS